MINFKLGTNFNFELLDGVIELNKEFKDKNVRINEFYGSDREHAFLAARPEFRLPEVSKEDFEKFVKTCNDNDIEFNYTMNSINPGSKRELIEKEQTIKNYVKYLENVGVKRITVANPILLSLIREVSKTINIEISTIAHIDAITQIKYYKETYDIDKVCGNLTKNRSIKFLKKATEYCNSNNVKYEVMVNEFCIVGGYDYSTSCIFRQGCYILHSSNITKEDALSMNGYPMQYCMTSRNTHPANWLRARFIRPEDVDRYVNIGITNFKITGRTGTAEYLLTMARAYLEKKWNGNLLSLWKPLETIYTEQKESEFKHAVNIPNNKLNNFLDYWFDNDIYCEENVCGISCKYCEEYYNRMMKNENSNS
jgi:collagenase-like PrtC family protease